jgi:hypothetical protein
MRQEDWILLHQAACRIVGLICRLEQALAMIFDAAKMLLARIIGIADSKNLSTRSFSDCRRRQFLELLAFRNFATKLITST